MSSETTELLGLPCIMPNQAQKHVTHNEALRMLDALIQLAVTARDLAAPPPAPAPGERHIVADGASGAWTGREGEIAAWLDGAWAFFTPNRGWRAWVEDEEKLLVFMEAGWMDFGSTSAQADSFGINTEADETNRLAVKSDTALFSHDDQTPGTGDMRILLNKANIANTAALLFQNGDSGRAEIGLAGADDLAVRVSTDGTVWADAIVVDRATGRVSFPAGSDYRERLVADRTYYVRGDGADGNDGLANTPGGAFLTLQHAIDVVTGTLDLGGHDVTIQCANGTYAGFDMLSPQTGAGLIALRGDPAAPGNVVIDGTVSVAAGAVLHADGIKPVNAAGNCVNVSTTALVTFGAVEFGAASGVHVLAEDGANVNFTASYTISGGASRHIVAARQAQVRYTAALTVTVTGTPAFSTAFAQCNFLGLIVANTATFSGSATGIRYQALRNSYIFTGGGASFFPGNNSGMASEGGLYG
jgi:hypothetical protein